MVRTVEATGLIYMLGETGYYHPHSAFCRRRYADGDFGDFVYGEGGYYHDMAHFYRSFWLSNDDWRPFASLPPMFYATHSTSQILGITFRRMTEVSCFGQADRQPDGIFDEALSHWNNSFSNESALFRTSDGGTARINEFRRIGHGTLRVTLLGTRGAFEQQTRMDGGMADGDALWTRFEQVADNPVDGVFDYRKEYLEKRHEDVSRLMAHDDGVEITEENLGDLPEGVRGQKTPQGFRSASDRAHPRGVRRPAERPLRLAPVPGARFRPRRCARESCRPTTCGRQPATTPPAWLRTSRPNAAASS